MQFVYHALLIRDWDKVEEEFEKKHEEDEAARKKRNSSV